MASPPSNSSLPPSDSSAPPPKDSPSSPPPPVPSAPPSKLSPPPPTKSPPPSPPPASSPPPSPPASSPPPPVNDESPPSVVFSPPPPSQSTQPIPPSNPGVLPPPAPKEGTIQPPPGDESSQRSPPSSTAPQSSPVTQNDHISINQSVVIGVVAGVGLFIILISACALVCFCKRKKNKKPGYCDAGGGKDYYKKNGSAPPGWRPQGKDHNIKIHPPPGPVPPPGGTGWQHHGSLTPTSGEMGSSNYSPHGANSLPPPSPSLGFNTSTFTYEELAAATGGFSQSNMLGQGGFGYVYKGILPNGKEVAIKQLKAGSGQGEREFHAEVEIISRVHHRHLVSLVGYCIDGAQRLLVYEFVPNNTLEYHLHGEGVPTMDWSTRLKIAIGSAKGLAYLHEDCHPRIIHRDIKTANILLDYKFEAMVADFGLAKLSPDTNTHVSTRIMGTFGYLAPEYASSGKLTDKSDVFSYGVMLLELITGRKPVDHTNRMDEGLVEWARPRLGQILAEENYDDLVDPKLEGNYNKNELNRMITCAAASIRHSGKKRPRMSQIVRALEGDMISFDDVSEAARAGQSSVFSTSDSEVESTTFSTRMRQFNKLALAGEEYTGEYSGITSEYGLNPSDSSDSSGEMHPHASAKPH